MTVATLAGCGSSSSGTGATTAGSALLVALVVPSSTDAPVAAFIRRGADLAMREINAKGVVVGGVRHSLTLKVYDDASDPQRAASAVAAAIHDGAVGVVEDGVGAALSAPQSAAAGVPEIVVSDGTADLLQGRSSLFRLAIPDDAAASVLGTYVAQKSHAVAVLHDDTAAGRDGDTQMRDALATAQATVVADREAPATAPALDAEVHGLADAHPGAVLVWGGASFTARAVEAVRAAGLQVPLFSGPQGESPTVRQVAGAAADGLLLPASRMTGEADDSAFGLFEHRLAAAEGGPIDAGVKDSQGREIRQPADRDLFAYDAVRVLAAAVVKAGSASPGKALLSAMTTASVISANGDHRGFAADTHEGLADDDIYVATIHDMQVVPVKDEALSASLPVPDELLADFH